MRRRETGSGEAGRRPRIGLFGRLGCGNIGNDAQLETVLEYLTAAIPDADLDFMCSGPTQVLARYGIHGTQMHWLDTIPSIRSRPLRACVTAALIILGMLIDTWRTATWVRRHDVVILPGAGVLESTLPQRPWQHPYSMFVLSCFGRLFATKVAFVCVGANVIRQRATRRLLAASARLAHYRSFRDEYSLRTARAMGIGAESDGVFADLVFGLPNDCIPAVSRGTVGVGVMAYFGGPEDRHRADQIYVEYVERMTQFVRWLVEGGHRVRLLIGDDLDEPVAEAIVADVRTHWRARGEPPVVYERTSSTKAFTGQLAPLDTVVAMRYHNVLFALKYAKPTIAIGYGRKHDALMDFMGVGRFVQDVQALDVEQLKEQFTALETNRHEITRMLAAGCRKKEALLEAQFAELTSVLFGSVRERVRSAVP